VHLGHRAILDAVMRRARETGAQSAVITFDPHPIRFLAPDKAPRLISTLAQKIALIGAMGVDVMFVARFDAAFAALEPDAFIRQYLVDGLRASAMCVGGNFNFGHRQRGTVETLRRWKSHFELIEVAPVRARGMNVSSTLIREQIAEGAVGRARWLLGRVVELEGRIVEGVGRGRRLTVPTFNLEAENELLPQRGVYVTRISLDGGPYLEGVTNIGVRPTFGEGAPTIETHALSGSVPAAASRARLQLLRRLRDERRFDSPAALSAQIAHDVRQARRFFHLIGARGTRTHALAHSR
jgi:riboflavin kinase/FMN adenylyltransferase